MCPIHLFVNVYIVELSLRSGDQGGECKEGDLPYMEGPTSHVLIGGACRSWPPLTQRHIKRGARRGTGTNVHHVHSAPQTLASRSDREGTEARGTAHCTAATVVSSTPTPPTPTTTTAAAMSSSSSAQGISK
jgi:hypothetical protein